MDQLDIFSATLGLCHPWHVSAIEVMEEGARLDIIVNYAHDSLGRCPNCGQTVKPLDAEHETWHHADFFRYNTYLHARVPRFDCVACGIHTVDRPWSRAGSKFALCSS